MYARFGKASGTSALAAAMLVGTTISVALLFLGKDVLRQVIAETVLDWLDSRGLRAYGPALENTAHVVWTVAGLLAPAVISAVGLCLVGLVLLRMDWSKVGLGYRPVLVGVGVTVEYLQGLFDSRTRLQGELLAKPFLHKAIEVEGTVKEIAPNYLTFEEHPGLRMLFDKNASERLVVLVPGAWLIVVGEIQSVGPGHVELGHCRISYELTAPPRAGAARQPGRRRRRIKSRSESAW